MGNWQQSFFGFRRENGRVGVRNHVLILPVDDISNAAVDEYVFFNIMRDVSADNQSGDARLIGIQIFFTTDAANDA